MIRLVKFFFISKGLSCVAQQNVAVSLSDNIAVCISLLSEETTVTLRASQEQPVLEADKDEINQQIK